MTNSNFPVLDAEYVEFVEIGNDDFVEVTSVEQHVVKPNKNNHFIEANTNEVTYEHLQHDCIVPSFATMEETISHQQFIGAVLTQLLPFELFSKKFCLKISELGLEIV